MYKEIKDKKFKDNDPEIIAWQREDMGALDTPLMYSFPQPGDNIKKIKFFAVKDYEKTLFYNKGALIGVLGGGVYDIMERPSNEIFFYPGLGGQFLNESLIFMLFLIMGMIGGLLAFRSTRYTYRPREAKMFLLIGLALLVVSFIGTEMILSLKGI